MSVHTEYNFTPGKYRAFVRTTYRNGLMQEATVTSNKYVFENNALTIISVSQGVPVAWDGSEIAIMWSGNNNNLTVQILNNHIVFKMYTSSNAIYQWTSPVGSSTSDVEDIYVQFLIDDNNEVAKPSFIYDNGNNTYQYNQESPTDAEMALIYTWLSAGIPS